MKNINKKILFLYILQILVFALIVFAAKKAFAAESDLFNQTQGAVCSSEPDFMKTIVCYLDTKVMTLILWISSVATTVMIILAGFYYMTSVGNPDTVKKATNTLKNAIIGLIIVVLSYSIKTFLLDKMFGGESNVTKTNPFTQEVEAPSLETDPLKGQTVPEPEVSKPTKQIDSTVIALAQTKSIWTPLTSCADVTNQVKKYYPEVNKGYPENPKYTYYIKGMEFSNQGKTLAVFYKRIKDEEDSHYDIWTYNDIKASYETDSRLGYTHSGLPVEEVYCGDFPSA